MDQSGSSSLDQALVHVWTKYYKCQWNENGMFYSDVFCREPFNLSHGEANALTAALISAGLARRLRMSSGRPAGGDDQILAGLTKHGALRAEKLASR